MLKIWGNELKVKFLLALHLHKMEVASEGQDRLHHRCEQLTETKNQHQGDEILMENMKSWWKRWNPDWKDDLQMEKMITVWKDEILMEVMKPWSWFWAFLSTFEARMTDFLFKFGQLLDRISTWMIWKQAMTINFEEQNESIKTKNVLKKCSSVNIKSACPNGY